MTIGKRIAAARRAAGLSQEGLAAQIGVSRQAVAKWETDASLPGADNLQELARALNTSCDELLTGTPPASGDGADLLPLLKSMQALIESQEAGRRAARRRTRWAVGGVCLAALLLLGAAGGYYASTLNALRSRVEGLDSRMAGIDGAIDSQLAGLRAGIEHSLHQQASIVASYDWQTELAAADGQAALWVSATPKESAEGLAASFTLVPDGGEPILAEGTPAPGGSFTATLPIPLKNEYNSFRVLVQFARGETVQSEELFSEYGFVEQFMPTVHLWGNGITGSAQNAAQGGRVTLRGSYSLEVQSASTEAGGWPVECVVELLEGDAAVWSQSVDVSDFAPKELGDDTAERVCGMTLPEQALPDLTLDPGKTIRLQARVTSSTGMQAEDSLLLWQAK